MKIFNVLFGILSIIVAVTCLAHPFASQLAYGYISAVFIGVMGLMSIVNWFLVRREAKRSGLQLISGAGGLIIGIFGVVFMLLNMTVPFFTYSVQEFGAILVMMFLLLEGVLTTVSAVRNRNNRNGLMRVMMGIFGVLMIVGCLFGIIFPEVVISMFGIFLGVSLLVQGISRIALALL